MKFFSSIIILFFALVFLSCQPTVLRPEEGDFACKLGGYVATQKGGAPRYTEEDVLREIR
uniref:hypothetical protein n=1 Tax=Algoriphagus sp. TaxID=1872435 RepID=UPI00404806C0